MKTVYFTAGDKHGWAIDEDLRQVRQALHGIARETWLPSAQIVESAYWRVLDLHPDSLLQERYVIAHADNPPFFYLKEVEFSRGQRQVNLWIARSEEARRQFLRLGLPVEFVPYTVDPTIFHPLPETDRPGLRERYGIPRDAYVIANFHRDTEGADLTRPKSQKSPEFFFEILRELSHRGETFHVLLAGPRRHYLRKRFTEEGIPFTFIGNCAIDGDDFGINILTRSQLNELYAITDLYLSTSRWEGGPQSVMEAAATRCKMLSTPVGLAFDVLEPVCLFQTVRQAADLIARDRRDGFLGGTVESQYRRVLKNNAASVLPEYFRRIYQNLDARPDFTSRKSRGIVPALVEQAVHTVKRRLHRVTPPASVALDHQPGRDVQLDEIFRVLRQSLDAAGVKIDAASPTVIGGVSAGKKAVVQFVGARATPAEIASPSTVLLASCVQDVLNLRDAGVKNSAVVLPFAEPAAALSPVAPWGVFAPGVKTLTLPENFRRVETLAEAHLLLVGEDEQHASPLIWSALAAGRPVLYPAAFAYAEQVFHGGLSYRDVAEWPALLEELATNYETFRNLIWTPTPEASRAALFRLLASL